MLLRDDKNENLLFQSPIFQSALFRGGINFIFESTRIKVLQIERHTVECVEIATEVLNITAAYK